MASENNDISEIVKKCKILLLDIEGTTTSISFVKDKLFPYAEANVKEFLESQWENENVKEAVAALRKLAIEDEEKKVEGVVTIPGEDAAKEEQIEGLVKSVKWQMSADRKAGALKLLQGLIWKQGYDKGDIKGHVYDDVAPALALWNASEGQKVYIYSSGSVQAQKLLFSQSAAGDLLPQIEGHFDTAVGAKQEAASYAAIVEKIGCKPEDILFLTDIVKEAEAARASGLQAALVSREGNTPLSAEATSSFPVLHSFEQLALTNKRKQEPQEEEEVPAKVPKTDIDANVKTAEKENSEAPAEAVPETVPVSETVSASESVTETATNGAEPDKMEVDEEATAAETKTVTEKAEETPVHTETIIEEVTEESDAPVCNASPDIIEESVEKTEKNETEKMETESTENVETVETASKPKEQYKDATSAEEAPSAVEIQDVTNEQNLIPAELVDEIEPVIEEPREVEMEDLNNVGNVLDKECDELLLKVHDTLDSLPGKPLLNSIAEEEIESASGENTNDIVNSILDSEMELSAKTGEDIDVNVVQEISDSTAAVDEVKSDKVEENSTDVNNEPKVKAEDSVDKIGSNIEAEKVTVSSSESVTEAATEEKVVPTEATNGDTEECPVALVNNKETKEPEPVDNKEAKEVAEKVSVTESEDIKMESDENVATTGESKAEMDVAVSSEKPVENPKELEKTTEVSKDTEIQEQLDNKIQSEEKTEVATSESEANEAKPVDKKAEPQENIVVSEEKMESDSITPQENKDTITQPEAASENNDNENEAPIVKETVVESKENESNETPMETESVEKVNGKMNGDSKVNQNGDVSKNDELSARLSVENGENGKAMNGANGNGDSSEIEMGQGDNKVETEIPDIKVKTVSTEEPRTDPIDQPVEA